MVYNENILVDILLDTFCDVVDDYVLDYVAELTDKDIYFIFGKDADYARLDAIDAIFVDQYTVMHDRMERGDHVTGKVQIRALIDFYVYWEERERRIGSEMLEIGAQFSFYADIDSVFDLTLSQMHVLESCM